MKRILLLSMHIYTLTIEPIVKRKTIIIILFCGHFLMIAQNYVHIDTAVAKYPTSFQSIEDFGNRIQKDFTEDADKVRAAYYWIANNIQYNYIGLETGRSNFPKIVIEKFTDDAEFSQKAALLHLKLFQHANFISEW